MPRPADRSESLTRVVRLVAREAGYDVDHDDLSAALGLSLFACAVLDSPDVGDWSAHGRDAFLIEAARLFGMNIREIHPPEAAVGLRRSPEFRQHFDASYKPLIEHALAHEQPVLAWRGWVGPRDLTWSVIRRRDDSEIGFSAAAATPDAHAEGEECSFDYPPVQVYVVETVAPTSLGPLDLTPCALEHAYQSLSNEIGAGVGLVTGPAAYDAWAQHLTQEAGPSDGPQGRGDASDIAIASVGRRAEDHAAHAASIVRSHESGVRFFQRAHDASSGDERMLPATLVETCGHIVEAAAPLTDVGAMRKRLADAPGREEISRHIAEAKAATTKALTALAARRRR